ncbi:hypothetical protein NGB36_30380 [Streptomyces sp. RB6PN25]|uniref:Uncharacterized protein n=1 Tax=Streptomyces humicola TaxID=2953240 RepID=A0ABT1Q4E9_9ACTN|nr:hypothetical protein [Streptomyces humicola]MCQ4084765.1 hypothetical protein [Streptomyces humicola]
MQLSRRICGEKSPQIREDLTCTSCRTARSEAGFRAGRTGSATLTATRASCGEALACTPAARAFTVTDR